MINDLYLSIKKSYYKNLPIFDFSNPSKNILKASISDLEQKYIKQCKGTNISEILDCKIYKQQLKLNHNNHVLNNRKLLSPEDFKVVKDKLDLENALLTTCRVSSQGEYSYKKTKSKKTLLR